MAQGSVCRCTASQCKEVLPHRVAMSFLGSEMMG